MCDLNCERRAVMGVMDQVQIWQADALAVVFIVRVMFDCNYWFNPSVNV